MKLEYSHIKNSNIKKIGIRKLNLVKFKQIFNPKQWLSDLSFFLYNKTFFLFIN